MTVIDIHAHIYPEKIAAKAVQAVCDFYNTETMAGDGTSTHLLSSKQQVPITHFVVHSVATTPKHVASINQFIAQQCAEHPEFIGFMAMHQDLQNPEEEINRAIELGLCGMKIHPDTQQVNIDDPRLMQVYEIIEGRIPLILHTGDYRHPYSNPKRLFKVMQSFPKLVVNAAHFGSWSRYDIGYDVLCKDSLLDRLYVDTSSASYWIGQRHLLELTRLWGAEHVLFGSDFPMWSPVEEYNLVATAGFTEEELELITYKNAERFLGFSVN